MAKSTVTKFFGGKDSQQFAVTAYNIIGTEVWVIRAYEKSDGYTGKSHGNSFTFDGVPHVYGSVNWRRITPEIDALKGEERYQACQSYHNQNKEFAYSLIWGVFPSLRIDNTVRFDEGDIEIESGAWFNHNPTENPPIEGNEGWKICGK